MPGFEQSGRVLMRLTLSTGRQIELSPFMVKALQNTVTATGSREHSCLDIDVAPETVKALERRGLVSPSPEGPWFVTARGLEAMDALELAGEQGVSGASPTRRQAEAFAGKNRMRPRPGVAPKRVTVHPDVPSDQARLLGWALQEGQSGKTVLPEMPGPFLGGIVSQVALCLGAAIITAFLMSLEIFVALLAAGSFCAVIACLYVERQREIAQVKVEVQNSPIRIIEEHKGMYATGEMLDQRARGMLGRAQTAVDAVLDSSLHREGLLLDEVRNRVVLTDVEWSLARDLYSQARTRHRIEKTPAVGERSRQAAERARAALAEDLARVESRIRTLESYAERVREAELEALDRERAAELDAIADHAELAGAIRPRHDESLSALIQAQELALEIAALSDDREPEGPAR